MMNIFKKLFLILKSTNSKISDFENFIEKWEKDLKKDSNNKMIEAEKEFEKLFLEYKNKRNFTTIHYSYDYFGKSSKEEYHKKFSQFQKDVENAIIKVENKEMTYKAFFDLVYFNKR